jgi:DNA invertase Pin-like site-specific DNA recombinase
VTERREYCIEACCEDPDNPGFPLPTWGHGDRCEAHTKQFTRHGKCTPIKPKLSPRARFNEQLIRAADADEDHEYESACRTAWDIAKAEGMKNLTEKDIEKLALDLRSKRVKRALERARREGKRLGRPPKIGLEQLKRLLEVGMSARQIAAVVGVSERAVWYALKKSRISSVRGPDDAAARPRAS